MNESTERSAVARDPILFGILKAAKALEAGLEEAFARIGLSTARYTVLEQLAVANEPVPLSELAARVSCVRSNMTQLVDRLEAEGLVSRVGSPSDRRAVRARLTGLGRERQATGAERFRQVQREFSSALPEGDRQSLEQLLSALTWRMDGAAAPGGSATRGPSDGGEPDAAGEPASEAAGPILATGRILDSPHDPVDEATRIAALRS